MLKLIATSKTDDDVIIYDIPIHIPFETFRQICLNIRSSPDKVETMIDELTDFLESVFPEDDASNLSDALVSWVYSAEDCGYSIKLSYEQNFIEETDNTTLVLS